MYFFPVGEGLTDIPKKEVIIAERKNLFTLVFPNCCRKSLPEIKDQRIHWTQS